MGAVRPVHTVHWITLFDCIRTEGGETVITHRVLYNRPVTPREEWDTALILKDYVNNNLFYDWGSLNRSIENATYLVLENGIVVHRGKLNWIATVFVVVNYNSSTLCPIYSVFFLYLRFQRDKKFIKTFRFTD